VVLSGSLRMHVGSEQYELGPGTPWPFPPINLMATESGWRRSPVPRRDSLPALTLIHHKRRVSFIVDRWSRRLGKRGIDFHVEGRTSLR